MQLVRSRSTVALTYKKFEMQAEDFQLEALIEYEQDKVVQKYTDEENVE